MTAPDRIWAQKPDIFDNCALWQDIPSDRHEDTEYVRADLVAALIRDAVDAERESCAKIADFQEIACAKWVLRGMKPAIASEQCVEIAAAIRARKGGA